MARPDTNASARKRTDVALAAIAAFDPQVRAFSDIRSVDARSEADDLDRLPATERGVLNGVTVAIKEVFDVAGCRCSWGTPIHANRIPKVDCDVVARIKSAGGIVLGTAASTEYAMARPAPTGNPYALERTPGASSSGSAAAVAARFVDLAIGSQTIGSGIRPAGYCGVLGLKPTHGAISLRGAMPLSGPLDHAVIMAREVGLVEAAFGVLTGGTTSASPTEAVEGAPRIALLKPWFSEPVDPGAWQLVAEVVQQITGGSAQSVTVPDAVASGEQACLETILAADMWRNHHTDAQLAGHVMSSALRAWLERGQRVGDDDYRAALSRKAEYSQTVWDAFAGFDVIATVATTGVAPLRRDGTGSRAPQRLWSLIGCPSIAVPIGLVEGLPIAVQLVARPHEEAALFAASRSIVSQFTVPPPSLSFGAVSLRPDPGPAPLPEPLEVSRSLSDRNIAPLKLYVQSSGEFHMQTIPILRRSALALSALVMLAVPRTALAQEVVNYGVQPATMPIYIAKSMGLLEPIEKKHNIKIALRSFPSGAPENQAMAAGELQMASAGMGPAVIASARLPATLVAITILEQTAIIVPKDSTVKSVAELKGKKVAFPGEGTQQYPLLLKALADAGLKVTDIELFKTDGSQVPTLLQNKSVDAGITWDPHVSNALAAGHSRVLIKAEKIMPIMQGNYVGNGEYVHNDFLKKRPEVVQDLITANVKAIDFILKDPKAAAKMWSKEIGFPEATVNYSLEQRISVYSRNVTPEQQTIDAYSKFLKEAKILQETDVPKVDPSFARKALAEAK